MGDRSRGSLFERVEGEHLCRPLLEDGKAPGAVTARAYLLLVCYQDNLFNGSNLPFCARQVAEALNTRERAVRRSLEALYSAGLTERAEIMGEVFYRVRRKT